MNFLQERFLIIGADPGHTIGLCALDFEGNVLHLAHLEGGGIEGAVSIIEKWGTPSLIACDVSPVPEFVSRLASYFNVKFFCPKKVMREEEKKKIAKKYPKVQNTHERDALSAAIFAWRAQQNMLRSALASGIEPKIKEKLCHLLLHGYNRNIALEILQKTPLPLRQEGGRQTQNSFFSGEKKENLLKLREKNEALGSLARINSSLQKRAQHLENENLLLRQKLSSMKGGAWGMLMREGEYRQLRAKNERLEKRIRELAKKMQMLSNRFSNANIKEEKPSFAKENAQIKKETWKKGEKLHKKEKRGADAQKTAADGILQEKEKDGSKTTMNLKSLNPPDMLQRMVEQYRKNRSLHNK